MGSQTVITVPVKVHSGSGCFDVFSVVYIEAAVIVLGVVDAVFSCTAIVTGYPLLLICDGRSPPSCLFHYFFRLPSCFRFPEGSLFRQVIPSTKCRTLRAAALSTLHWARALRLWTPGKGLPLASRAGAAALHPAQRACHPLDSRQHKGVMRVFGHDPFA